MQRLASVFSLGSLTCEFQRVYILLSVGGATLTFYYPKLIEKLLLLTTQSLPRSKPMKTKTIYLTIFLSILMLSNLALAETKTVTATGKFVMGDLDSKSSAKKIALMNAKQSALEKAGTFLTSSSEVQNYQLTKDEITTLAAGVMSVEILEEKWTMEGESPAVKVTIKATIDTGNLDEQIQATRENKEVVDAYKSMEAELADLRQELEALKEAKETAKSSTGESSKEIETISEKKQHAVKKILAIDTVKEAGLELKRGNTQAAIDLLNPVLIDDPDNATALAIRAYAYSRIGNQDKALADIDRSLELKPNAPKALLLKGTLLLRQGNASGAVDTLSKAIRINSDCGRCYLLRGKAFNQLNQYRKAYHNFKKACQKGESKGCEKVRTMEAKRKEKKQPQKQPRRRY